MSLETLLPPSRDPAYQRERLRESCHSYAREFIRKSLRDAAIDVINEAMMQPTREGEELRRLYKAIAQEHGIAAESPQYRPKKRSYVPVTDETIRQWDEEAARERDRDRRARVDQLKFTDARH